MESLMCFVCNCYQVIKYGVCVCKKVWLSTLRLFLSVAPLKTKSAKNVIHILRNQQTGRFYIRTTHFLCTQSAGDDFVVFLPCGTNLIAIMMMQLKIFMENMLNNLHENFHCLLNRFNKNIKQTEKNPNENGGKKFIFMTISGKYYGSNVV